MVHSSNGAAICIWAFAALQLAGCAEVPGSDGVQVNAPLAGTPSAQADARPADNLLKLASDVEARGSIVTALPLYERAAATPDSGAAVHVKLGDIYTKLGRNGEAVASYRTALAKAPDNGAAMLGLGGALVRAGQAEEGVALLAKAAPIVNSARAYDRLGVAHIVLGHPREAVASFEQAHALDPGDLDTTTNLALAAALSGQKDKAVALAQATLRTEGIQDYHRRNLILAMAISDKEEDAKRAASSGVGAGEIETLINQGRDIRKIASPKARALALGTVRSASVTN
jgi:tetratricopeptide (TPR) repeat protein